MATSFVNDLNALANSLSGAAQSVAGLYQTRVQLETMRLQSELQAKDDEFLSRLYLPDDDPNKINIDNWETALNNHKADQENLLGNQRWKRVSGAVRTNLAPEVSGFNQKFAQAMYTQERKYIQSETMGNVALASERGDVDSVKNVMQAGIDSRLFDDPGAARLAQAKYVTEAWVNKIGMELASGEQNKIGVDSDVMPLEGGNIDIHNRKVAKLADGSSATVRSISIEEDGVHVLIPTISDDGDELSDDQAISMYKKTGKHLGKFSSIDDADKYAEALHDQQSKEYTTTAYERAVRYINAKVDDRDAKIALIANENAKAKAATEAFKKDMDSLLSEQNRSKGTVPISQAVAAINSARAGGYVDSQELAARESELEGYFLTQEFSTHEKAVGRFMSQYEKMSVPIEAENAVVEGLEIASRQFKDNTFMQEKFTNLIKEARNYASRSREGDDPLASKYSLRIIDLQAAADTVTSKVPRSEVLRMGGNIMKDIAAELAKDPTNKSLVSQYSTVSKLMTSMQNREDGANKTLVKLMDNETTMRVIRTSVNSIKSRDTPLSKAFLKVDAGKGSPDEKALVDVTMLRYERAMQQHIDMYGTDPKEFEKATFDFFLELTATSGASNVLPGARFLEGNLKGVEEKASKYYSTAKDTSESTNVSEVFSEQHAQTQAVLGALVRDNSEALSDTFGGATGFTIMVDKQNRDRFIARDSNGKTYQVSTTPEGKNFIIEGSRQGQRVILKTTRESLDARKQKEYDEWLRRDTLRLYNENALISPEPAK